MFDAYQFIYDFLTPSLGDPAPRFLAGLFHWCAREGARTWRCKSSISTAWRC